MGDVINSFGETRNNKEVADAVSKVALKFVYLALGAATASFLHVLLDDHWRETGCTNTKFILENHIEARCRFFDKEINSGKIVGRMSGDTVIIQEAMGEKVGSFIQLVATFIGGFVIAFTKGWLLTLVMLSSISPLVFSTAIMNHFILKLASHGQAAYSEGENIAEKGKHETLINISNGIYGSLVALHASASS